MFQNWLSRFYNNLIVFSYNATTSLDETDSAAEVRNNYTNTRIYPVKELLICIR